MEADAAKGPPPPPSPLTGCYLLIVVGEPHSAEHKDIILQRIAKGLLSWDIENCHVDLEKELQSITSVAPEGEEARHGERLIQFATENLVSEVLIHPAANTLIQCMKNLLSSFTRHRHIIYAGYTFGGNGSWALQDGTFSLADFSEAFQENEVQRVIKAYENTITIDIHCSPEGDWTRLPKESFTKSCKIQVNPNDVLTSGSPSINNFLNYLSPFLVPSDIETLLESSDVVGNIRFSHPTLYVFPGGQGDAALFGINGFNMLVDGGFARKACFWDFTRHLDRLDAVLVTRLNNSNVCGISSVLRRKTSAQVYPQIGHFFCNLMERKANSPDGDKDKDPLLINLLDEGHNIILNLKHLNLRPQMCYRDSEPINLYHKVGHGTLDMYVLSPAKDSKEVREFLQKWNSNDQKLFATRKESKEFSFPLQNLVSICALLVWQPANPSDTITRLLFPGSTPQHKIFEGLDKLKHLEFMKHPVCTAKTLTQSGSILALAKSKQAKSTTVLDKILPTEQKSQKILDNKPMKEKSPLQNENKQKIENKILSQNENKKISEMNGTTIEGNKIEKVIKSNSLESDKSEPRSETRKTEQNGKDVEIILENKSESKSKPRTIDTKSKIENKQRVPSKARSESTTRKSVEKKTKVEKKMETKPSPPTPKKIAESKVNGVTKEKPRVPQKLIAKSSPSSTPAKSTKDANNRKVVESKYKPAAKKEPIKPPTEKKEQIKVERKPISRRPKAASPARTGKVPASPSKKLSGVKADKNGISRTIKLDKEGTTDSSAVSTPSADQDSKKIDVSKLTKTELEELKAKELADLKEEQEVVKEIEAVFRKDEKLNESEESDLRKIKEVSIEDKTTEAEEEEEEYLIVEKEEVELNTDSVNEPESATKEDEIQKHQRDSEESEKPRKGSDADKKSEENKIEEETSSKHELEIEESKLIGADTCKVLEIVPPAKEEDETVAPSAEMVRSKEDSRDKTEEMSKEISVTSPEDKLNISSEKKLTDTGDVEGEENKETADQNYVLESQPDEKFSTTIESGATTAPTLPEDERIPLDEIKEDQVIEEKHVKEETKEKEIPTVIISQKSFEPIAKISPVIGMKFDAHQSHIRDIVKTPDEVADLPVHEEVDIDTYDFPGTFKKDDVKKVETGDIKAKRDTTILDDAKTTQQEVKISGGIMSTIKDTVKSQIEGIKDKIDDIKTTLEEKLETVTDEIKTEEDITKHTVKEKFEELKDEIESEKKEILAVRDDIEKESDDAKAIVQEKIDDIRGKIASTEENVKEIQSQIEQKIRDDIKEQAAEVDKGKEKIDNMKDVVQEKVDIISETVKDDEQVKVIDEISDSIKDTVEEKVDVVKDKLDDQKEITEVKESIEQKGKDIKEEIKEICDEVEDIAEEKTDIKLEKPIVTTEISDVSKQLQDVKTIINDKDDDVKDKISVVINDSKDILEEKIKDIEEDANNLKDTVCEKIKDVKDTITDAKETVIENIHEVVEDSKDVAMDKVENLKQNLQEGATIIEGKIEDTKDKITDLVKDPKDVVEEKIDVIQDKAGNIKDIVQEKIGDTKEKASDIISDVKDIIDDKSKEITKTVTNIVDDSKEKVEDVEEVISDVKSTVEDKINDTLKESKDILSKITDSSEHKIESAKNVVEDIKTNAEQTVSAIKDGIIEKIDDIKETKEELQDKVTEKVISVKETIGEKLEGLTEDIGTKSNDSEELVKEISDEIKISKKDAEKEVDDTANQIFEGVDNMTKNIAEKKQALTNININEISKIEDILTDKIKAPLSNYMQKEEEIENIVEEKIESVKTISDEIKDKKDEINKFTEDIITSVKEDISDTINTVESQTTHVISEIEHSTQDKIESSKDLADKLSTDITDIKKTVIDSMELEKEPVVEKIDEVEEQISQKIENIVCKKEDNEKGISEKELEKNDQMENKVSDALDKAEVTKDDIGDKPAETVRLAKNDIKDNLDNVIKLPSDQKEKTTKEKFEEDDNTVISDAKEIISDIIKKAESTSTNETKEKISGEKNLDLIEQSKSILPSSVIPSEKKIDDKKTVDDKIESDISKHELPLLEDTKEDIEGDLNKVDPIKREADVIRIVSNVAHVLKSDAPLEELASTLPVDFSTSFKSFGLKEYTTELRETHITTLDSPLQEDTVIVSENTKPTEEFYCPKQSSLSFLEEERNVALENIPSEITKIKEEESQENKISNLAKSPNDLISSATKIISDIQTYSSAEQLIDEKSDKEKDVVSAEDKIEKSTKDPLEKRDSGIVHRMLVTASSEDGGEETVICPTGSITFMKNGNSDKSTPEGELSPRSTPKEGLSGRSTPEKFDEHETTDIKPIMSDKIILDDSKTFETKDIPDMKIEKSEPTSSGKSTPDKKVELQSGKATPDLKSESKDLLLSSGKSTPDIKIEESQEIDSHAVSPKYEKDFSDTHISKDETEKTLSDLKDTSGKSSPVNKDEEKASSAVSQDLTTTKSDDKFGEDITVELEKSDIKFELNSNKIEQTDKISPDIKDEVSETSTKEDLDTVKEISPVSNEKIVLDKNIDEGKEDIQGKKSPEPKTVDKKDSLIQKTSEEKDNMIFEFDLKSELEVSSGKTSPESSFKKSEVDIHVDDKEEKEKIDSEKQSKLDENESNIEQKKDENKSTEYTASTDTCQDENGSKISCDKIKEQLVQPGKLSPEVKEDITEDKDGPPEKEDIKDIKDKISDIIVDKKLEDICISEKSSGKATPDIKSADLSRTSSPMFSRDIKDDTSGKDTPELKSDMSDKKITETKNGMTNFSGISTPDLKFDMDNVSLSGKSTPNLRSELENIKYSESGKSTPDVKNDLNGKKTPEMKQELSGISTPDLKLEDVSDKTSLKSDKSRESTPDISAKETVALKEERENDEKNNKSDHVIHGIQGDIKIDTQKVEKNILPVDEVLQDLKQNIGKGTSSIISDVKSKEVSVEENLLTGKISPEVTCDMKDKNSAASSIETIETIAENLTSMSTEIEKESKKEEFPDKSSSQFTETSTVKDIDINDIRSSKQSSGKSSPDIKSELLSIESKAENIHSTLDKQEKSSISVKTESDILPDTTKVESVIIENGKQLGESNVINQSFSDIKEKVESGKSTPDPKCEQSKSAMSTGIEQSEKSTPELKVDDLSARSTPDQTSSSKITTDIKEVQKSAEINVAKSPDVNESQIIKITVDKKDELSSEIKYDAIDKNSSKDLQTTETTNLSIAGPSYIQKDDSVPSSGQISPLNKDVQHLSSEDLHLSGKSTPDIADIERMKEMHEILKHEKHIPGSSTPPTVPVSPIIKDSFLLQSDEKKEMPFLKDKESVEDSLQEKDVKEQDGIKEIVVPVNVDLEKSFETETKTDIIKTTTTVPTTLELKEEEAKLPHSKDITSEKLTTEKSSEPRCSTPGSDDYEMGGVSSPHSDISSGQMSRVAHAWGQGSSEERQAYSDDEDVPGSPTSVTSQMAHSPPSNFAEYQPEQETTLPKVGKMDPMNTSFYGALPDDPLEESSSKGKTGSDSKTQSQSIPITGTGQIILESEKRFLDETDVDFEKAMLEHREARGSDLIASGAESLSYKYEITTAKVSKSAREGGGGNNGIQMKEINKNGFDKDLENTSHSSKTDSLKKSSPEMMTSSFIEESSSGQSTDAKKDPIEAWGKPLGLPSPALPPTVTNDISNKTTPKKMPQSATLAAKNKINDERKRSDSPSKYDKKNKKIVPVYMDLTYVPHHGNSYYSFVEFFKRVRARYYVFSGTEPSRDVYNALLEAKQTWEDKDLEVTIIPTYDTDVLGYWVAENEDVLAKYKIDLSPSASRCTINLQDHETSCSAYRLEF